MKEIIDFEIFIDAVDCRHRILKLLPLGELIPDCKLQGNDLTFSNIKERYLSIFYFYDAMPQKWFSDMRVSRPEHLR